MALAVLAPERPAGQRLAVLPREVPQRAAPAVALAGVGRPAGRHQRPGGDVRFLRRGASGRRGPRGEHVDVRREGREPADPVAALGPVLLPGPVDDLAGVGDGAHEPDLAVAVGESRLDGLPLVAVHPLLQGDSAARDGGWRQVLAARQVRGGVDGDHERIAGFGGVVPADRQHDLLGLGVELVRRGGQPPRHDPVADAPHRRRRVGEPEAPGRIGAGAEPGDVGPTVARPVHVELEVDPLPAVAAEAAAEGHLLPGDVRAGRDLQRAARLRLRRPGAGVPTVSSASRVTPAMSTRAMRATGPPDLRRCRA